MRPGSSLIEIQAYGFDTHVPHLQDPLFNAEVAGGASHRPMPRLCAHPVACLPRPETSPSVPLPRPTQSNSAPSSPSHFSLFQDADSQVLWWVLQGCDPGAWRPCPAEAARKASPTQVRDVNRFVLAAGPSAACCLNIMLDGSRMRCHSQQPRWQRAFAPHPRSICRATRTMDCRHASFYSVNMLVLSPWL